MNKEHTQEILVWLDLLSSLAKDKSQLDAYEKKMVRLVESTMSQLHKEISSTLVKECGEHWEPYLEDFDTLNWVAGAFQSHISDYVKEELRTVLLPDEKP